MRRRLLLISGLLLICLTPIIRPAIVTTDDRSRLLVLLRWQSGTIRFINSVTEKPVTIDFGIGDRFRDFSVTTDETTEVYYTNGQYAMNEALSNESKDVLKFCSMRGIHLNLGFYGLYIEDGCMEVRLLWTI